MPASFDVVEFHLCADAAERVDQSLTLREWHVLVGRAVRDVERRRAGVHLQRRAGRSRGIRQFRRRCSDPPRLAGPIGRVPHVVIGHREHIRGSEPVHHTAHVVAAESCQSRESRPGRDSPQHDARGIHAVFGAMPLQPRDRRIHVIQLRGEARLTAEPVFARGDRETRGHDAIERPCVADPRREHLAGAAQPPPAVEEHDEGSCGGIRGPQVEGERTEPLRLREVDLEDRRHDDSVSP